VRGVPPGAPLSFSMTVRSRLKLKESGLFFITTTITDWIPAFHNPELAIFTLKQLSGSANNFNISIVAYVLMPSHLHALVGVPQMEVLSPFVQSFKSLTSRYAKENPAIRENALFWKSDRFAFWKRRFDDVLIISETQFCIKIDYIHNNPVRDRLVKTATDYPYSSAIDWLDNKKGLIALDKDYRYQKD
jgi:putative transposase